jgi:hypothetical protein
MLMPPPQFASRITLETSGFVLAGGANGAVVIAAARAYYPAVMGS